MCGILGFYSKNKNLELGDFYSILQTLNHRGPDDYGVKEFNLPDSKLIFGHKRLSINDTSFMGNQPMSFEHLHIVFNGEIYNFKEIKVELIAQGYSFESLSDTEVILKAFHLWGKNCVSRFTGMFAFVIFNDLEKTLTICRDRIGVKPFYYYLNNGLFLFASELKAFHKFTGFEATIDKESLVYFLQYGFISNPRSIFENTYKLEPGFWLELELSSLTIKKESYWNIEECFRKPEVDLSYEEASTELEAVIQKAANYRMVADVPVGIFLSGGYDSSYITALLQKERTEKLKTFTIGFPEGKDETIYAKAVADYLGTDHTQLNCTKKEAEEIIPDLVYYFDEPCGDVSCIPTILISRLASKSVKVVISADGGDEVLGGYFGYRQNLKRLDYLNTIPRSLGHSISKVLTQLSEPFVKQMPRFNHRLKGLTEFFEVDKYNKSEYLLRNSVKIPDFYISSLIGNSGLPELPGLDSRRMRNALSVMQLFDFKFSLPDVLLVKVDRATMSASIECREPFLDHSLIEFAATLPKDYIVNNSSGKIILKDLMHKIVPRELMDRPKVGFDLPLFDWLRNDFGYLIDENLSEMELAKHGFFDPEAVKETVRLFRENRLLYIDIIWRLIIFQMWFNKWCSLTTSKI